jgi:antiviral helicase SLH1
MQIAPTGAVREPLLRIDACSLFSQGKTDVAMLTILRVLDQHRRPTSSMNLPVRQTIDRDAFKIIYV